MKKLVILAVVTSLGIWLVLVFFLLGTFPGAGLLRTLGELAKPASTYELGESLGLVDGLFSSVAIVLALIAVLIQSKELHQTTQAQERQADALTQQLLRHEQAIRVNALAAEMQFLGSEVDWLEDAIEKAKRQEKDQTNLIKNCSQKIKRYRARKEGASQELSRLLGRLSE